MIDIEKYKEILNQGLLLDHYNLLQSIHNKTEILDNKRIRGFSNLLSKKGYLDEGELTDKAKNLIATVPVIPTKVAVVANTPPKIKMDYGSWIVSLHKKCEEKLLLATGKRQVRDSINGKPYSFLPNATDLGKVILRAMKMYSLDEYDRIERTILLYIDKCIKAKNWFPILQYYIFKNNMSPMVTDMESLESDENEAKSDDTIVNI